ncbi:unnamed protein product [marine sediment metagenome]|uniref:methenyltetrahydrofolate cyclohydrolase n=1 Tax=marine sediment metagenome TaxID=412755 RepID=X1TEE5_9ZZZZ
MNKVSELYVLGRGSDFGVLQKVEIVISGIGNAGLIKPDMLKEGAGVIDFGYNFADEKLTGDLDISSPQELSKLLFYTPTPGGTGPILVAQLFENFYRLKNL